MIARKIRNASFIFFIFLILTITLNFSAPVTSANWKLVYEHDSNGNKISGDLDELIDAAMQGNDIKVMLHFYSAELHYQMLLSKVKVDICNRILTGYNFDFRQNPAENNVFCRISSYSTNGDYISIYEENKFYLNPEVIRVSMSWYIKD